MVTGWRAGGLGGWSSENAGRFVHLDLSAAVDEPNEAAGMEMKHAMHCTGRLTGGSMPRRGAGNPYEYYYTVAHTSGSNFFLKNLVAAIE